MNRPAPGLARQRTALAWHRTCLDFVVVGTLLLHVSGGRVDWVRYVPAGLAFTTAGVLLVAQRLRRGAARPLPTAAGLALTVAVVAVQAAAAVVILPQR